MVSVNVLSVLFFAMFLVSMTKAVSLDGLPNAMQEIIDEVAELKRQFKVLEQNNMVRNQVSITLLLKQLQIKGMSGKGGCCWFVHCEFALVREGYTLQVNGNVTLGQHISLKTFMALKEGLS